MEYKKEDYLEVCITSAPVTLQLVDKDNRDVCGLSAVDPRPNCGLASALSSMMLQRCPILGLVKQVLPSKDSCWLASANGVVASSGKGRTVLQTIVLPLIIIISSSSRAATAALSATKMRGSSNTAADKRAIL